MADRETGTVKKWIDKGFGFITRDLTGDSIFVHASDTTDRQALVPGSKVSFTYEADEKGGKARGVAVEDMAEAVLFDEGPREMGTIKRWNADKGYGFISRTNGEADAFFHKRSFGGLDEPYVGQAVSFVFGEGPKGAAATKVQAEEGDNPVEVAIEQNVEEEEEREMGVVKTLNEEKGFAFIVRCVDATEIFGHKREFADGIEPRVGQPVSFVYEVTEKGGTAKKIHEEDGVPPINYSDEGRDFGTIKSFNQEKGFGFIIARKDGEEVRFFEKALNGLKPVKSTCVSYDREEGEKGALAKDLREEDPDRVARVTARLHYGKVVLYKDPPPTNPNSGHGFIVELDQLATKQPKQQKRHYFHMSEIETPDEQGGIDKDTGVSFIIIPARKGTQAASVTIADPPKEKPVATQETTGFGTDSAWGGWGAEAPVEEKATVGESTADGADGAWGAWGEAVEEKKATAGEPTADTEHGAWGAWDEVVQENKTPADAPTPNAAEDASNTWGEVVEEQKTPADEPTPNTADGAWGEPMVDEEVIHHKDNETTPEKAMEDVHLTDTNEQSEATDTNEQNEATENEWGSGGW